ncbi:MAG: hypothetical protein WCO60_13850 [Verrucomicrobiota bacterium]
MNKRLWILASVVGLFSGVSSVYGAEAPNAGTPPSADEQKAYAELGQRGVLVQPLAAGSNWFYVSFRGADKPDSALYSLLKGVPGTVELDLSGQKLAESDFNALEGLKNLRKLNLSKSSVNDAALSHLSGLSKLESLNLFQTEVGDAGLANLKGMAGLKRLYVYQTKVTDTGIEQVKAAMPGVKVEKGGAVLLPPKKDEPKKDDAEAKK